MSLYTSISNRGILMGSCCGSSSVAFSNDGCDMTDHKDMVRSRFICRSCCASTGRRGIISTSSTTILHLVPYRL